MRFFLEESFGIRGNLSPLALAKNKGTEVFRLVPLRGEVSESVPCNGPSQYKEVLILLFLPNSAKNFSRFSGHKGVFTFFIVENLELTA